MVSDKIRHSSNPSLADDLKKDPSLYDPKSKRITAVDKAYTSLGDLRSLSAHRKPAPHTPKPTQARFLYLSRNAITDLQGIQHLINLRALSLAENKIASLDALLPASTLYLHTALFEGNPIVNRLPFYRAKVINLLGPALANLDNKPVSWEEHNSAPLVIRRELAMLEAMVANAQLVQLLGSALQLWMMNTELLSSSSSLSIRGDRPGCEGSSEERVKAFKELVAQMWRSAAAAATATNNNNIKLLEGAIQRQVARKHRKVLLAPTLNGISAPLNSSNKTWCSAYTQVALAQVTALSCLLDKIQTVVGLTSYSCSGQKEDWLALMRDAMVRITTPSSFVSMNDNKKSKNKENAVAMGSSKNENSYNNNGDSNICMTVTDIHQQLLVQLTGRSSTIETSGQSKTSLNDVIDNNHNADDTFSWTIPVAVDSPSKRLRLLTTIQQQQQIKEEEITLNVLTLLEDFQQENDALHHELQIAVNKMVTLNAQVDVLHNSTKRLKYSVEDTERRLSVSYEETAVLQDMVESAVASKNAAQDEVAALQVRLLDTQQQVEAVKCQLKNKDACIVELNEALEEAATPCSFQVVVSYEAEWMEKVQQNKMLQEKVEALEQMVHCFRQEEHENTVADQMSSTRCLTHVFRQWRKASSWLAYVENVEQQVHGKQQLTRTKECLEAWRRCTRNEKQVAASCRNRNNKMLITCTQAWRQFSQRELLHRGLSTAAELSWESTILRRSLGALLWNKDCSVEVINYADDPLNAGVAALARKKHATVAQQKTFQAWRGFVQIEVKPAQRAVTIALQYRVASLMCKAVNAWQCGVKQQKIEAQRWCTAEEYTRKQVCGRAMVAWKQYVAKNQVKCALTLRAQHFYEYRCLKKPALTGWVSCMKELRMERERTQQELEKAGQRAWEAALAAVKEEREEAAGVTLANRHALKAAFSSWRAGAMLSVMNNQHAAEVNELTKQAHVHRICSAWRVAALKKRVERVQCELTLTQDQVCSLEGDLTRCQRCVEGLKSDEERIIDEKRHVEAQLQHAVAREEELSSQVHELKEQMISASIEQERTVAKLTSSLERVTMEHSRMTQESEGIKKEKEMIEEALSEAEKRVATLQAELEEKNVWRRDAEERAEQAAATATEACFHLHHLTEQYAVMGEELQQVLSDKEEVERQAEEGNRVNDVLMGRLQGLEGQKDVLENRLKQLEEELDSAVAAQQSAEACRDGALKHASRMAIMCQVERSAVEEMEAMMTLMVNK